MYLKINVIKKKNIITEANPSIIAPNVTVNINEILINDSSNKLSQTIDNKLVLIFDTYGGLCNQFYDITNAINFCLKYNIFFTFRYCSFRNSNLNSWELKPFEEIFDINFISNYNLYIDYDIIKHDLTHDNCFNLNSNIFSHLYFKSNNILDQIINLNKKYVVLKQFWSLNLFRDMIDYTIISKINPCHHIIDNYNKIKNIIINNQPYNFIHYRYESDFTKYFNVEIESLDKLIERIKFKNNNLKIFIATLNIKNLINLKDDKYKNLLYKNDDELTDLNFEQKSFIDYMFGLNSVECYGHNKSSFSVTLNTLKHTSNYYNI